MSRHPLEDYRAPDLATYSELIDSQASKKLLLGGLIPTDCIGVISGKAKRAYKTWWAMWLSTKFASGHQCERFPGDHPRRVYFLEAEGPQQETVSRWRWIAKGLGLDPYGDWRKNIRFAHRAQLHLDDQQEFAALKADILAFKPDLIVIDTLAAHQFCDENKVQEMHKMMQKVGELKDVTDECSAIVLHHLRKDSKDGIQVDIDEDLRGSSAIAASYDFHHGIRAILGLPGTNLLTQRYSEGEDVQYELRWEIDGDNAIATCHVEDHDPDRASEAMMVHITSEMLGDWDYSIGYMSKIIKVVEYKALKVLKDMVNAGHLEKRGKNHWGLPG